MSGASYVRVIFFVLKIDEKKLLVTSKNESLCLKKLGKNREKFSKEHTKIKKVSKNAENCQKVRF